MSTSVNMTALAIAAKACAENPLVQKQIATIAAEYGLKGYEKGIYRYGGPGIIVGMCVPIVVLNAMIAFWRISYHVNIRSGLLALATVLNLIDVGNAMVGRSLPPSRLNVKAHLSLLIFFGAMKLGLIVAAASYRFGAVITNERTRRIFTTAYTVFGVLWAGFGIGIGLHDVLTKEQASRFFWIICAILPFTYMVPAVFTFTMTLKRTESKMRSSGPNAQRLTFLRISNNTLVAVSFICAAVLICVTQTEDSHKNYFVVPTQIFMGGLWLLAENCFELMTVWQNTMSSELVSQAVGSTSGGGQKSQADRSVAQLTTSRPMRQATLRDDEV